MGCGSSATRAHVTPTPAALAVSRGARRQTRPAPRRPPPALPAGYAVLFAVDEYARFLSLKGAVADATALGAVLEQLGFEIAVTLYNAQCTPAAVESALLRAAETLPEHSRLCVFFAGHGKVHAPTGRVFYCTPQTHPERLPTTGFDLEKVHALRDFLPRHQLWVMDFCFSGGAAARSRGAMDDYAAFAAPSVQFMSAGNAQQLVSEIDTLTFGTDSPLCTPFGTPTPSPKHQPKEPKGGGFADPPARSATTVSPARVGGLFAVVLVRVLRALAQAQGAQRTNGGAPLRVSATDIFLRVRRKVLRSSETLLGQLQTPQLDRQLWWRDDRADGEFVF